MIRLDQMTPVQDELAQPMSLQDRRRAQLIRRYMAFRRQGELAFPQSAGADANWAMLVELYLAAIERRRESISSLCVASGAPPTTALRYIKTLTDAGIVEREPDPADGRRVFVSMCPPSVAVMQRLFDDFERSLESPADD